MQSLSSNNLGDSLQVQGSFSEINVTPLVDVMLVLLIIFMVTAPLLQQGIDIKLPQAAQKDFASGSTDDYVLTITKSGKVFLNEKEIPTDQIEFKLRQLNSQQTIRAIFLRADQEVSYGTVIGIVDKVKSAGIQTLGMVTEPLLSN